MLVSKHTPQWIPVKQSTMNVTSDWACPSASAATASQLMSGSRTNAESCSATKKRPGTVSQVSGFFVSGMQAQNREYSAVSVGRSYIPPLRQASTVLTVG